MSLLPFVLDGLTDHPRNQFGVGLYPEDLWQVTPHQHHLRPTATAIGALRPWLRQALSNVDGTETKSHIGKDGFQVCLDVHHFSPNEITVKTIDNSIVVEAKHEEKQDDHGYISRQFTRRYDLPKGFNAHDVVSTVSSDGILSIKAAPATPAIEGNVRHVQIQQVGPAHLNVGNKPEIKSTKK